MIEKEILKSENGLVQIYKCCICKYMVVWGDLFLINVDKKCVCKWCNEQGRYHE